MAKNLFDFGDENCEESFDKVNEETCNKFNENNKSNQSKTNFNNNKSKEDLTNEAKNLYEKYKDYSQNELINEFLTSSKQKLKDGSLTSESIRNTANTLLPLLNDSQKAMMSQILERLND